MTLKAVNCPHCGRNTPYSGNPFRPFCSERCQQIDLGRWADEDYRIPSQPVADSETEPEQGE